MVDADDLANLGTQRFGTNLTIEEEKVEFPKGKDNLKIYIVSISNSLRKSTSL